MITKRYLYILGVIVIFYMISWWSFDFFLFTKQDNEHQKEVIQFRDNEQKRTKKKITNSHKERVSNIVFLNKNKILENRNIRKKNRLKRKKSLIIREKLSLLLNGTLSYSQKKLISIDIANDINRTKYFNILFEEYNYLDDMSKLQIQFVLSKITDISLSENIYQLSSQSNDDGLINSSISALKNINTIDSKKFIIKLLENNNILDNNAQYNTIVIALSESINNNDYEWIINDINTNKYNDNQIKVIVDSFSNNRYLETVNILNQIKEKYYYDDQLVNKINSIKIKVEKQSIQRELIK